MLISHVGHLWVLVLASSSAALPLIAPGKSTRGEARVEYRNKLNGPPSPFLNLHSRLLARRELHLRKLHKVGTKGAIDAVGRQLLRKRRLEEIKSDWQKMLEPWIPAGVAGYVDLILDSLHDLSLDNQFPSYGAPFRRYEPSLSPINIPNYPDPRNRTYKMAEMGYYKAPRQAHTLVDTGSAYLIYAKSSGRGSIFWILKSRDQGCSGGNVIKKYAARTSDKFEQTLGSNNETEYPVILRSPFANDRYYGAYAYCITYDPNPRGSTMRLGAAPCERITCAPAPSESSVADFNHGQELSSAPATPDPLVPILAHNPDGTLAPKFFTTRPCDYLDPSCHASQIFLYNSLTGIIRPMYRPGGMEGYNATRFQSGKRTSSEPRKIQEPLWRNVAMRFRVVRWPGGSLQDSGESDPTLLVTNPAFDVQGMPQPELPKPIPWSVQIQQSGVEDPYPLSWWEDDAVPTSSRGSTYSRTQTSSDIRGQSSSITVAEIFLGASTSTFGPTILPSASSMSDSTTLQSLDN